MQRAGQRAPRRQCAAASAAARHGGGGGGGAGGAAARSRADPPQLRRGFREGAAGTQVQVPSPVPSPRVPTATGNEHSID